MDTNVKDYKNSVWVKLACILLALLCFSASAGMIANSVMAYVYWNGTDKSASMYQSEIFENALESDTNAIVRQAVSNSKTAALEKILDSYKSELCDKIYEQYLDYSEANAPPQYDSSGFLITEEKRFSAEAYLNEHELSISFTVNYSEIDAAADKAAFIEEQYEIFADNTYNEYSNDYAPEWDMYETERSFTDSLVYFTDDNGVICGNQNDVSASAVKQAVTDCDVYFVSEHGKMQYKGLTDGFAERLYSDYIKSDKFAGQADIYIGVSVPDDYARLFSNIRYWNDSYVNIAKFHDDSYWYEKNSGFAVTAEAVLMLASFILGFFALTLAGKRSDGGKVRIIWLDKIPFEIHFAINFAAGAGIFSLAVLLGNGYIKSVSPLTAAGVGLIAVFGWLLVFEFCYCVARFIHSGRKLKTGFLAYKAALVVKKMFTAVSATLKYKPKKFSRNIILIAIIYILCNLVLLLILWGLFSGGTTSVFGSLLLLADIAANIYFFIKVLKYIQQLDMIISASAERKASDLDPKTLPQSLKTLEESMRYTNTELQNAVAKAVKDERLRSELITNVSHDLKTPLTSIITYVDLLSKCKIDDEKAKEYIKVLDDKGAKLKRLIEDLIEASKVTSGNVSVNLTHISLAELCLQSTVDAQSDFEKTGLTLMVKNCEKPPVIYADGAKTFRVIENLLSNARKYSAVGSRVYVDVYSENGCGVFEIKNISAQPLDISPDELTERFVRGDKSRNQEGNGLGLSIAKELCRLQNGDLQLIIDGDLFKARVKLPLAKKIIENEVNK